MSTTDEIITQVCLSAATFIFSSASDNLKCRLWCLDPRTLRRLMKLRYLDLLLNRGSMPVTINSSVIVRVILQRVAEPTEPELGPVKVLVMESCRRCFRPNLVRHCRNRLGISVLSTDTPARISHALWKMVEHLTSVEGADVRLTLEISAEVPSGVDNIKSALTENAKTFGFENDVS